MKIQLDRVNTINETQRLNTQLGRIQLAKSNSDDAYDKTLEKM